eukprot:5822590-Prymnesium_polylepis.1
MPSIGVVVLPGVPVRGHPMRRVENLHHPSYRPCVHVRIGGTIVHRHLYILSRRHIPLIRTFLRSVDCADPVFIRFAHRSAYPRPTSRCSIHAHFAIYAHRMMLRIFHPYP